MTHERILIVEDEKITAAELYEHLQQFGYQPLGPCASGEEAITSACALRPDAVLMDIALEGPMDGIQAAETIRSICPCPVIYVTAHSDQATLDRAKVTEPFGYVLKPINERELRIAIEIALHRHKLEEKLRESEERYRTAIEHSNDGVAITQDGKHVYVNHEFLEMFGYSDPEEILNKSIADAPHMHPDDLERVVEWNRQRLCGETVPLRYEHKAIHKDGRTIYVELSSARIMYQGKVASLSYMRDITEGKQAGEELLRSETKFRTLFDSTSDAVMLLDENGFFECNKATLAIFGCATREEFCSKHPSDVSPPEQPCGTDSKTLANQRIATAMERGSHHFEWMHKRADTEESFPADVLLNAMELDGKQILQAVVRDITERKLLETQLVQAQKLESIGQLAAGIAHEINTPTQYVGDNIHFLKESFAEVLTLTGKYRELLEAAKTGEVTKGIVEEVEESIEKTDIEYLSEEIPKAIQQSMEGVERVSRIVRAMKEFSHPGTKEKKLVDINKAIENTLMVTRNEWKYVSDVVTEFDRSLPLVPCLPGEFNQVILNIIINAAQAIAEKNGTSAEKGSIRVSTLNKDGWAEIRIADTGPGIPDELRLRVFDPFFTTKEVGKGTGQGLAIARSVIVDKHQGEITLDTVPGEGTTFIVRLPLGAVQG